jgi:DNA polymerase I-like protein with 3'-5' exonuclease and polymerase domains
MVDERYAHLPLLNPAEMNPALNPTLVTDGAGLEKVRSFLSRVTTFGFDTETNFVDSFFRRRLRTLQFGDRNEQYVIDLLAFADGNSQLLIDGQGGYGINQQEWSAKPFLRPIIEVVSPSLTSNSHLKVGANLQWEYEMCKWNLGLRIWNFYGVDMAERTIMLGLVFPNASGHFALEDLVARYVQKSIDKELQTTFDLETPLTEGQVLYAALDTRTPLAVRAGQLPILTKDGLLETAELENAAIPAFGDMRLNGLFLNREKWTKNTDTARVTHTETLKHLDELFIPVVGRKSDFSDSHLEALEAEWRRLGVASPEEKAAKKEAKKALLDVRTALRNTAREAFYAARKKCNDIRKSIDKCEGEALINYGSNPQLLEALWQMKGLSEATLPSTNDEFLVKHAGKPVIDALREFRTTKKTIETYGDEFLEYIDPDTGRIHSNIAQIGASTGRTSSSNPNLQNIPKEKEVRSCFEPQHGRVMLTIDMAGAELRIIADLLRIESWIEAFNKKWDVHSMGTELLYPEQWPYIGLKGGELLPHWDDPTKIVAYPPCAYFTKDHQKCKCPQHNKLRDGNKACNFLLAYGGGPDALAAGLGTDRDTASDLMALHKRKNPDVWAGLDRLGREAKMKGESRSMGGRRRIYKLPTWEVAKEAATKELEAEAKKNKVEPRPPTEREIKKKQAAMFGSIERQGKNLPFQSTNVDMAKRFMGAGFDKNGIPFLWHTLETKYNALLCSFVHDEVIIECYPENAEEVKAHVFDAIHRSGEWYLTRVEMLADGNIANCWKK